MQATKTNPGIPVSPATTTGRSKKQTNPTQVVQRAYNIQYFVDRITVHGNVHPAPYRCTNPVSITCQLTQAKKAQPNPGSAPYVFRSRSRPWFPR